MIAALEQDGTSGGSSAKGRPAGASYDFHRSVLLAEIVKLLQPAPGKVYLDGTLGGGGHSAALLDAGARVIGIDQDPAAIDYARKLLAGAGERFTACHGSFSRAAAILQQLGCLKLDGALLDLGVSSRQLDAAERGFSFMNDGPLDMRMDPGAPMTAADLVNTLDCAELERIFRTFGEEPACRRVANRLVHDRQVRPFTRTRELAEAVEAVIPRHGKTHPATRVFQGLRIAVNQELEALETGLAEISALLAPGARFGIITFHSLEDRIVKTFFKSRATEFLDRPEWPEARPNPDYIFRRVTLKPATAAEEELRANPRSRSAKLRVVERVSHA